jgi:HipA-like protein
MMPLPTQPTLRTVSAIRYVTPLREGGSLPAIVEADDGALYVLKFHGAGQGPKALIAELVVGAIGRALGLLVPEIVLVELDPQLGRAEPDQEIQELVQASAGLNLALAYLPGALGFDPSERTAIDPALASAIVWFDAYTTNVDRTARNPNMLLWRQGLWLIDHGAALYIHYTWTDYLARSRSRFPQIKDHVLLPLASALPETDAALRSRLSPALLDQIVGLIPDSWLRAPPGFATLAEHRAAYTSYLQSRLESAPSFVEEALHARAQLV